MKTLALILLACFASVTSASALTVRGDYGGYVEEYAERWKKVAKSGVNVRIDGQCQSACTLVLVYVPLERICVTARAAFGFHQAYYDDARGRPVADKPYTAAMVRKYPHYVRRWLREHGGVPPPEHMLLMRAKEMVDLVKPCLPGTRR